MGKVIVFSDDKGIEGVTRIQVRVLESKLADRIVGYIDQTVLFFRFLHVRF